MPLYEFYCADCELVFEKLCSHSERNYQTCYECGVSVTPLVTTPNIHVGPGYDD